MSVTLPSVLAVGAAHVDRRARSASPYRAGASNPGSVVETVGGAVLNAALALRLVGTEVRLCSARGGDAAGERVAETLETAGISDHSFVWLDRTTASYTAILDDRGDLVAGIADMAIYDLLRNRVFRQRQFRSLLKTSDALFLDANLSEETIAEILEQFGERPSAAIAVSPAKAPRLSASLPRLSAVFLSRAEAAAVVGTTAGTDAGTLARRLAERGAVRAVVTDGPDEAAILDEDGVHLQAPRALAALRDVTGAGDTLAGIAFAAYLGGMAFRQAVRLGMAGASRRISTESDDARSFFESIAAVAADMAPPRIAVAT